MRVRSSATGPVGLGRETIEHEDGFAEPADDHTSRWKATIERVLPAVVVLRVNYVRAFDGEEASYSYATGFVVDAERGLILTNRHVVSTGPVTAEAVFLNKEEVQLTAVYRDPVHDFGFFSFDPKAVQFMKVTQIDLAPDAAEVGLDVRVVGNDAGEKISILSGTLARLDRAAPRYSTKSYNDFNTFYYSAASNTSGGSSGSPVLDVRGRAVALNAGAARRAASSYYLPLHCVDRALRHLQSPGTNPSRGTLRAVFKHSTFDEVRRLGLTTEAEAEVRRLTPGVTGMLVCDQVIPSNGQGVAGARGSAAPRAAAEGESDAAGAGRAGDGDGDGAGDGEASAAAKGADGAVGAQGSACAPAAAAEKLEAGDVLMRIRPAAAPAAAPCGAVCTTFLQMEQVVDECVGSAVALDVQRGGAEMTLTIPVEDLYALTPSQFVEVGGCIFHPISFTQARNGNLDLRSGVYVSYAGYMLDMGGVPGHAVITAVGATPTPTLDSLEAALVALPELAHVMVRYYDIGEPHNEQVAIIQMSRRWFPFHRFELDMRTHEWSCRDCAPAPPPEPLPPADVAFTLTGSEAVRRVIPSICRVQFDVAYAVDGVHEWHFAGSGLVLDAEAGLILVDRNTLPTSLGDIRVAFGASAEVSARAVFFHQHHNWAVLRYDPGLVRGVQSAALAPAHADVRIGDKFEFAGLSASNPDMVVSQPCRVVNCAALETTMASVPRFKAINEEVISVDHPPQDTIGGCLVDADGCVVAIWASYSVHDRADASDREAFHAFSTRSVGEVLAALRRGEKPALRSLEMELSMVPLSTAVTKLRLPQPWAKRLQLQHPERCQCLLVGLMLPWSRARTHVLEGDVLLAVDAEPVVTFRDVELRTTERTAVDLTVLRNGEQLDVRVETHVLDWFGTREVLVWQGLVLQPAHRAVSQLGFMPYASGGVYIAYFFFGSPAHRYNITPKMWIKEVNGTATRTIEEFALATATLAHGEAVRIKTVDLQAREAAYSLKLDAHFWRTQRFRLEDGRWG